MHFYRNRYLPAQVLPLIRASNETSMIFFIKVLFSARILGRESTMDLVPVGIGSYKILLMN
jgi:hypothetical protein